MTTSSPQRTGPVSAPPEYRRLLKLTLISAGLYLLYHIGYLVSDVTHRNAMWERVGLDPEWARSLAENLRDTVRTHLILLAVAMVIYGAVYIGLKKGNNLAWIGGIVLAIVGIIGTVFGILEIFNYVSFSFERFGSVIVDVWAQVVISIGLASGIALLIVNILWLITAFKKPVARWFAPQS